MQGKNLQKDDKQNLEQQFAILLSYELQDNQYIFGFYCKHEQKENLLNSSLHVSLVLECVIILITTFWILKSSHSVVDFPPKLFQKL
jgi:hypothetical protein